METLSTPAAKKILLIVIAFLVAYPAVGAEVFVLSDGVTTTTVQPILDPAEANEGAFDGGTTGTFEDTREEIQVPEAVQRAPDDLLNPYNIPTSAPASPLDFGMGVVAPFTQKLLRFEEFGPQALPSPADYTVTAADVMSYPPPNNDHTGPNSVLLDMFLGQDIFPYPTRTANTAALNPWETEIENFLGRDLISPPAEGRPPGELWSHQRLDEINPLTGAKDFFPRTYVQTAQSGARTNGGLRDSKQRHGYGVDMNGNPLPSEFAPGGLYHNTLGNGDPAFNGQAQGIQVQFHPNMPVQLENSVFTFDGTFPPKLLNVRYGEGVLFRHYNALPIDPAANNGFGLHTLTTHEHNGHTPAESDGYTQAFFFPGQFYDYRWPIQLAGYDSINTTASEPRAGMPNDDGTITNIRGDYRETMSTHWFHDHMLDFTASNVFKGNAAMMNYYSSIDRGNEAIDDGVNLRFPSGTALGWGNRDYDVNLMIADKAWDANGQLFFNPFNTDGFLGDRIFVNWLYKPSMDVRARRYRFRILDGAVSRYFKFAVVTESGAPVPIYMIANDGNIMEHAVLFSDGILPALGIAERYDIVIDFANYTPGTKLYMMNVLEHKNGRGPEKDAIPLADILSGAYNPVIVGDEWVGGDPVVGSVMEFVVQPYDGTDLSMNPVDYVVGLAKMIPLPTFTAEELANATHRTYVFGEKVGTDEKPWTIKTDGVTGYNMDPRRLSAAPDMNGANDGSDVEIWHLKTGGGWSHPIHVHFEEGQILTRDGLPPPEWETVARKDVYRIGPEVDSSRTVSFAIRFREFAGTYMEHCHNTQHEDTAMLLRWDIENPGQTVLLPTPMPTWDGVTYVDSFALATFRTGVAPNTPPLVGITSPATGASFVVGTPISFTGSAIDVEDDDALLTAALAWTSSEDGAIGTGGSFSTGTLSVGTHIITASVTDSGAPTFNPLTGSASTSVTVTSTLPPTSTTTLLVSLNSDRSAAVALDSATLTGDIFVFTDPAGDAQVDQVIYSIDGVVVKTENNTPFDLAGGPLSGANPTTLAAGVHMVSASISLSAGGTASESATFTITDPPPPSPSPITLLVSSSPGRSAPVTLDGASLSGDIFVFTDPAGDALVDQVIFSIDGVVVKTENNAPYDLAGGSPSANPTSLAAGTHTVSASIALSAGGTATESATFTITSGGPPPPPPPPSPVTLLVSSSSDRSASFALDGASLSGDIFVFTHPASDALVDQVIFSIDGVVVKTENNAPYDLAGGSPGANPTSLADGTHTVSASISLAAGGTATESATFTITGGGPPPTPPPPSTVTLLVSSSPDRSAPVALDGATLSGGIFVFTDLASDPLVNQVIFSIDGVQVKTENNAPYDLAGSGPGGAAATSLAAGVHTVSATIALSAGGTATDSATFTIN